MFSRKRTPSHPHPVPCFEVLEARTMLSATAEPAIFGPDAPIQDIQPMVVAGDPNGSPADSPSDRVDPNTTTSLFAGVGSVFARVTPTSGYIGTGTVVVDPWHVLTAGHVLDTNNDGVSNFAPSAVTFYLNYGGNQTHAITASAIDIHPDFNGFNKPAGTVNDDVAVITLSTPVPDGVPIYPLFTGVPTLGDDITVVGYGRSGDGVNGYTTGASFSVKRWGGNEADVFNPDDEGTGIAEVFRADFDGPSGTGFSGGATLGNDFETTLGGGDSGGPSFINVGGDLLVYGINTFTFSSFGGAAAPLFGSGWGGMLVSAYTGFIDTIINPGTPPPPTSETVDVIKASYNSSKKTLTVEATSSLGGGSDLSFTIPGSVTVYDMSWNASKGKWAGTASGLSTAPATVTVTSAQPGGASDTAPVTTTSTGKPSRNSSPTITAASANSRSHEAALIASFWHTQDNEPGTGRGAARQVQVIDLLSLVKPAVS